VEKIERKRATLTSKQFKDAALNNTTARLGYTENDEDEEEEEEERKSINNNQDSQS
jgi:hypothetical protein